MATRQYIGARYITKFADPIQWNNERSYEQNEAVQYNGFTYLSKQPVPSGVEITNTDYWLVWADPNAQMEQLRQEVETYDGRISDNSAEIELLNNLVKGDFIADYHKTSGAGDTSYIFIKMARSRVAISHHGNSGSDALPLESNSNAYKYVEEHPNVFLGTNAGPSLRAGTRAYRLNGASREGGVDVGKYIAFDVTGNPAYFNNITALSDIPDNYVTAFPSFDALILNNTLQDLTNAQVPNENPRNVFGWDENNYYILFCEGRGLLEKGLTIQECQTLMYNYNVKNAVNLDGGGSVCLALNSPTSVKINKFRDLTLPFNTLRDTPMGQFYTLKDTNPINNTFIQTLLDYKNSTFGYVPYKYGTENAGSVDLDVTLNTWLPIACERRTSTIESQFELGSHFTPDSTRALIPLPYSSFFGSKALYTKAILETQIPSNAISSTVVFELRIGLYKWDGETRTLIENNITRHTYPPEVVMRDSIINEWYFTLPSREAIEEYEIELEYRLTTGALNTFRINRAYFTAEIDSPLV